MSSKVWDDLSMWNIDFSNVSSNLFDLKRVNELELALLDVFDYQVKVSASDYAKYYFQLRSLIARLKHRSHFNSNNKKNVPIDENSIYLTSDNAFELMPLDISGARKLQLATEKYEISKNNNGTNDIRRRSTTAINATIYNTEFNNESTTIPLPLAVRRFQSDAIDSLGHHHISSDLNHFHHPVLLEQLIHAEHNDADGVIHTSTKNTTPKNSTLPKVII